MSDGWPTANGGTLTAGRWSSSPFLTRAISSRSAVTVAGRNPGLVRRLVIAEANLDPLPRSATGGRGSHRIAAQAEDVFVATGFRECGGLDRTLARPERKVNAPQGEVSADVDAGRGSRDRSSSDTSRTLAPHWRSEPTRLRGRVPRATRPGREPDDHRRVRSSPPA